MPDYEGLLVFDANPLVIRDLKARGVVVRHETYDHAYPHCWRTGTPLIYKAVSSWFVKVTAIKERMLELNQQIRWTPEHLKEGSFGKWLANVRDWTISRNRFWGSPIPVWRSDDPAYPASTCTDRSTRSSGTSASGPTTCTARWSTSSSAPTPTIRPDGR